MAFLEDYPDFQWNRPIYIIGNPRSGTSLFRLMLHLHSQVSIPPESHFFLWLEDKYPAWDLSKAEDYIEDLYNSTKFETWQMPREELQAFILRHRPATYPQLNSLIYLFYTLSIGKTPVRWGDKNKLWKEKLPNIEAAYPDTQYIHVIRDGRDIACSFRELAEKKMTSKYAPRVPTDIEHLSERWHRNISAIRAFEKDLPEHRFLTVRYEDLLTSTSEVMERAFAFLGLPFEPDVLDYYHVEDREQVEPAEFFQWKEKLLQPPDVKNMGKYKSALSREEIEYFNQRNGELLGIYGYEF